MNAWLPHIASPPSCKPPPNGRLAPESALMGAAEGMLVFDDRLRIGLCNGAAVALLGLTEAPRRRSALASALCAAPRLDAGARNAFRFACAQAVNVGLAPQIPLLLNLTDGGQISLTIRRVAAHRWAATIIETEASAIPACSVAAPWAL